MQQMKHFQQDIVQKEQSFTKHIENADINLLRDNVYIYRFYFMTSLVAIILSIILIYVIADHFRLKDLVTGLQINKTL